MPQSGDRNTLAREELFALVWERPATEVAHELGISDVALVKLCRRLQVPKPPRGYWARVGAGQTPKQPPLRAFREQLETKARRRKKPDASDGDADLVRLTQKQRGYLQSALDALAEGGVPTDDCKLLHEGVRGLTPTLAAQVLLLVQSRFDQWVPKSASASSRVAARQSIRSLVAKLLPVAKEQIVIFRREDHLGRVNKHVPAIMLRLSPALQQIIARMYRLVRENGLSYAAHKLDAIEYAWSVNHLHSPGEHEKAASTLCISTRHIWIESIVHSLWEAEQAQTERLQLKDLLPIELLPTEECRLPSSIPQAVYRRYAQRLVALRDAERIYEMASAAAYTVDTAVPDERLALLDRLCFNRAEDSPFIAARRAWRALEAELETWGASLELERAALSREVLGVEEGDTAVITKGSETIRIKVNETSVHIGESEIIFLLQGLRYRKDGLPGKRAEVVTLAVENALYRGPD